MEVFKNHVRLYRNCIKVFWIVFKCAILYISLRLLSITFYFYDSFFLTIKICKKRVYRNEAFFLLWDCIKVPQTSPFYTTGALRDLLPFAQFIKSEKHPWSSAIFSKVSG